MLLAITSQIVSGYTEELARYFIQQYVSHPINVNTATEEELRYVPFLTEEDIKVILQKRPFRSMNELREALGMSYREFSFIRYYIYVPTRDYRGYVSLYGGLQYIQDSSRNLVGNSILDTFLNHLNDYELDVQVSYANIFLRSKTYKYGYSDRTLVLLGMYRKNVSMKVGHVAPRLGYGILSYRPRYYFVHHPNYLFPNYTPSIDAKLGNLGIFLDTSRNILSYATLRNVHVGLVSANYRALWGFVEFNPIGKFYITLEGLYGERGKAYGYTLQYRDRGIFIYYLDNRFLGENIWQYTFWEDTTFFYVSTSYHKMYMRFAIRGSKGTITLEYQPSVGTRLYLRHYRHPFFRAYTFAISQSRGVFVSLEKVRQASILTLGYNLAFGRGFGRPYLKVRIYLYDVDYPEFSRYGWSAYEGYFPGVDSRIVLKGRGMKASLSLRYRGFYFRWVDGGRWEIGMDRDFFLR